MTARDPYCYPGTEVLKNKVNIRDQAKLTSAEAAICMPLFIAALEDPGLRPADFSDYLKLHRRIFGTLYPWAGKVRTVDVAKPGEGPYAKPLFIDEQGKKIFGGLASEGFLENLGFQDFVTRCAYYMGELHVLHPFREGNTRTLQLFVRSLAMDAGFELDWTLADPNEIRSAGNAAVASDYSRYIAILGSIQLDA